MPFIVTSIINEIILTYRGEASYLWSFMLNRFSTYENRHKIKFNRNTVVSIARPLYKIYMEHHKIKYLISKMDETNRGMKSTKKMLKHPNTAEIFKCGVNIFHHLYQLIDEFPVTCIVLSGECIRISAMPNVYRESNRGNILSMIDEYKNWYLKKYLI